MLPRSSEHLYLDIMEGVNDIFHLLGSNGCQQLKHLHVQNNAEVTSIIKLNAFPTLESLCLYNLASLESVCCGCQVIAEHFRKLQSLTLLSLPKLVSFLPKGATPIKNTTMGEAQFRTRLLLKEDIVNHKATAEMLGNQKLTPAYFCRKAPRSS